MDSYKQALEAHRFWDSEIEQQFEATGAPSSAASLQIRGEVEALCDWISSKNINSYAEIGLWTGGLISCLHSIFSFRKLGACDIGLHKSFDLELNIPYGTDYFEGNSLSPIYLNWRQVLGDIDLLLIDTDHTFESVSRNFEINKVIGVKHVAFCGISEHHRGISGVKAFWEELEGEKFEILCPHKEVGLEHSTIGIGIWSAA